MGQRLENIRNQLLCSGVVNPLRAVDGSVFGEGHLLDQDAVSCGVTPFFRKRTLSKCVFWLKPPSSR